MSKEMLEQKDGEDVNVFKIVDNGNTGDILQQQDNGDKLFVDPTTVDFLPTDGDPGDILQLDLAGDEQWVDPQTTDLTPPGNEDEVLTIDDVGTKLFEPIPVRFWQPTWVQAEYKTGTMTVDGGWTMLSNKLTSERAAPQALGDPVYGFDDTETYLENSNSSNVFSGHSYTFTKEGWIERLRVRVPSIDPDINYRFIARNITKNIVLVIEVAPLIANTWTEIAIGSEIVAPGDQWVIFIDALDSSGPTAFISVTNHWVANPDYAVVTGFLEFNGVPQAANNTGFGIDIHFQEAAVSEDWDYVAGGGVSVVTQTLISTDSTMNGSGSVGDPLSVDEPYSSAERDKLALIEDNAIATVTTDITLVGAGTSGDPLTVAPHQYGEIFAAIDLTQVIGAAGNVLVFDTNGISNGVTPDQSTDSITVNVAGDYQIFVQGSVTHDNVTIYELSVRVDTVIARSLGKLSVNDLNNDLDNFGLGAVLTLAVGEVVDIFVEHDGGGTANFDIFSGSRLFLLKLGD